VWRRFIGKSAVVIVTYSSSTDAGGREQDHVQGSRSSLVEKSSTNAACVRIGGKREQQMVGILQLQIVQAAMMPRMSGHVCESVVPVQANTKFNDE